MLWVFGYGSLIWKPPPHVVEQKSGYVKQVLRRFAQSSLDHRGTPERPGRVVTVIEAADWHRISGVESNSHQLEEDTVWGVVYRIAENKEKEVWDYLEHREKNGYTAHEVEIFSLNLDTQREEVVVPKATCWIGTTENPAFIGNEPMDQLAHRILSCQGPSGPNRDYLYKLAESVRTLYPLVKDDYLFDLERRVKALEALEEPALQNGNVGPDSHGASISQSTAAPPAMHPENPYLDNPPDFDALAQQHSTFKPFVHRNASGVPHINFQDPKALRELTRCLLLNDFDINVTLPEDRICPTVANRLDYVLYLSSIDRYMREHSLIPSESIMRVLDVGTGATPIYPLLLARLRPDSRITGSDIDEQSLDYAKQTLDLNPGLKDRIKLVLSTATDGIFNPYEAITQPEIVADDPDNTVLTFTMSNPPFYSSTDEMDRLTLFKAQPSHAVPTAAHHELVTPGGEVEFVGRMVDSSIQLGKRCLWYTSLLGKSSSIVAILNKFKANSITNYFIVSLRQSRTTRWIIGWSFTGIRLPDAMFRRPTGVTHRYMPPSNTFQWSLPSWMKCSRLDLIKAVKETLATINLTEQQQTVEYKDTIDGQYAVDIKPTSVTWSRKARRQAERQGSHVGPAISTDARPARVFQASLYITESASSHLSGRQATNTSGRRERSASPTRTTQTERGPLRRDREIRMELHWVWGHDRVVVESFWGHIQKRVYTALASDTSRKS